MQSPIVEEIRERKRERERERERYYLYSREQSLFCSSDTPNPGPVRRYEETLPENHEAPTNYTPLDNILYYSQGNRDSVTTYDYIEDDPNSAPIT